MRHGGYLTLIVALVLCGAGSTQAHEPRIAAVALNCFVPLTPGLQTRAVLVGRIKFARRTVRFVAQCGDDPAAARFPALQWRDGPVQLLDVSVDTTLTTETGDVRAQSQCRLQSRNGFLFAHCCASEALGGEVEVLVSIAPPPPE